METVKVVLIVAKCIVNLEHEKIYIYSHSVLIVAKCIVNFYKISIFFRIFLVLIVAKCIVNVDHVYIGRGVQWY